MDKFLNLLERLNRRQEARFWIKNRDMNFAEARLFLELTHRHFSALVRAGMVPYRREKGRGRPRVFNKIVLNLWLVQICFMPLSGDESHLGKHFIKIRRVKL
jgi:hypothetical protein